MRKREVTRKSGISQPMAPRPTKGNIKAIFEIVDTLSGDHNDWVSMSRVWKYLPAATSGAQAKILTQKKFRITINNGAYRGYLVRRADNRREIRIATLHEYNRCVQNLWEGEKDIWATKVTPDGRYHKYPGAITEQKLPVKLDTGDVLVVNSKPKPKQKPKQKTEKSRRRKTARENPQPVTTEAQTPPARQQVAPEVFYALIVGFTLIGGIVGFLLAG